MVHVLHKSKAISVEGQSGPEQSAMLFSLPATSCCCIMPTGFLRNTVGMPQNKATWSKCQFVNATMVYYTVIVQLWRVSE